MTFEINTDKISLNSEEKNSIYKLSISGELSFNTHHDLSSIISDFISKGYRKILLDMSNLVMIDSVGIGILIKTQKMLQKEKGELILTGCKSQIMNILIPININRVIKIFEEEEDGINFFTNQ